MTVQFPTAQHFVPAHRCQKCGKSAGELKSHRNETVAYLCERHANAAIKASHRRGQFMPDAVLDGKA